MTENPTWIAVVAAALRRADGRWLMHRRPLDKHHGRLWEFPGGKVESEEIPIDALVREIREELGIELDRHALHPVAFADGARDGQGREIVILLYTCQRWTGEPAALEGGMIDWFTPDEIAGLEKPPLDQALAARLLEICAR